MDNRNIVGGEVVVVVVGVGVVVVIAVAAGGEIVAIEVAAVAILEVVFVGTAGMTTFVERLNCEAESLILLLRLSLSSLKVRFNVSF